MNLFFNQNLAIGYKSQAQIIRVLSESWVASEIFCPNCGSSISSYKNNNPVGDFYCLSCAEDYELKSKKDSMGTKIVDGAYQTMIEKIQSSTNPNFFFLNYDAKSLEVINFAVIPKHFFVPEIVERRKPLSQNARRAGWIGCNILLDSIPESGKIFYVKNKQLQDGKEILQSWKKTLFLRNSSKSELRGWIVDIMKCIERIGKNQFTLQEVYSFEQELKLKYQGNSYIKDKIRQQLQLLRDRGYIEFVSRGVYRLRR
ncbi:restriction endonuclease [Francisella tularensis subsp. novicida]|uniref:DpnI domain-containing protein n=1 Tax=Francisella tularensis TaxID=263 RepID=UPI000CE2B050|nr:DpnI domain-containing protein [Francisella tularensis]AVC43540.1 restriction endonuclease [Francisella tularensis subsp. novicida]